MLWLFKLKSSLLKWLFNSVVKDVQPTLQASKDFRNLQLFNDLHVDMKKTMNDFEKCYSLLYGSALSSKSGGDMDECNPWLNRVNKDLLKRVRDLEKIESDLI